VPRNPRTVLVRDIVSVNEILRLAGGEGWQSISHERAAEYDEQVADAAMSRKIEAEEARALIALHTVTSWEPQPKGYDYDSRLRLRLGNGQVLEREDSDEYECSKWYLDAS
jgi:hypothetical protein